MQQILGFILLLIGSVFCQNDIPIDLQDLEKTLGEAVPGLKNFDRNAIPSIEEVQEALQNKCEKNGGSEAYNKLEAAKDDLQECIESNFNFSQIQEELDEKRKTGSMEEVFAKYCLKVPVVQACLTNLTDAAEACLEEEEKSNLKLLLNISDSLANFACYKEGDRIAMFVAEGGFECLESKKEGLENCANETFSHRLTADLSLTNLPLFVIDDAACDDYLKFQSCTVKVLETCDDNTPANIVDALFKFVRRITPCKSHSSPTSVLGAHRRVRRSNGNDLDKLLQSYDQFRQGYEPHCLKNGGQKAVDEFRKALTKVDECQKEVQLKLTSQSPGTDRYSYMCKEYRVGLRGCLADLTRAMEACTTSSESYFPKFGLKIYDSIFKFSCENEQKALKKLLGEQDICMQRVLNSTEFCLIKTKYIRNPSTKAVITQSELCSDLQVMRDCFVFVAGQQCPNSNTNELIVGFSDSLHKPCSGTRMIVSLLLISVLSMLLKFF